MTDAEKNEVLARWGHIEHNWDEPDSNGVCNCRTCGLLSFPCDPPVAQCTPDFLHSLDAQAKWLWTKLLPDYEIQLRWEVLGDVDFKQGWNVVIFGMNREHRDDIVSHGETPAEAWAEAILSLIGESNG